MPKKTYVIMDTDGRYYHSFCDAFLTTAYSRVLVLSTSDFEKARKFRSLRWATHRARFLSVKASDCYYVYEVTEQGLIIRNEQVVERIRYNDFKVMEEVEIIIAEWKATRGLD